MTNPGKGINALLISFGIIDSKPYSDKENNEDKKRNKGRPKYGGN
jgi:hypothetical protein